MSSRGIFLRYRPIIAAIVAGWLPCRPVAAAPATAAGSGNARCCWPQTFSERATSGQERRALLRPDGHADRLEHPVPTPIEFSVSGPFQSRGKGPAAQVRPDDRRLRAPGRHGSLVRDLDRDRRLRQPRREPTTSCPASDFQKLESSLASTSTSGSQDAGLSESGIDPLHWLTHPSIVGTATVGGASTTHIRAGVNVSALLSGPQHVPGQDGLERSTATTSHPDPDPGRHRSSGSPPRSRTPPSTSGPARATPRCAGCRSTSTCRSRVRSRPELGGMSSAGIGLTVGPTPASTSPSRSRRRPTSSPNAAFETKLQVDRPVAAQPPESSPEPAARSPATTATDRVPRRPRPGPFRAIHARRCGLRPEHRPSRAPRKSATPARRGRSGPPWCDTRRWAACLWSQTGRANTPAAAPRSGP